MTSEKIKELIVQGESETLEFKSCMDEISSSVYETVCSFLNRSGGYILMGISDNGEIVGVNPDKANTLLSTFITTLNNGLKITPNVFIDANIVDVDGKKVICAYVQKGESPYHLGKNYYDRNKDADLNITDKPELLSNLFSRKNNMYSENQVIPYLSQADLDSKTFTLCRNIVSVNNPTHVWISMTDEEILNSVGLFGIDTANGHRGLKLAALLLFGSEEALSSFYPRYRIDAIYRNYTYKEYITNNSIYVNRYDDRLIIRTNLISAYQSLIDFAIKHLPDKFYLEEGESQRTDLRINIFREVLANLLVHREYSNPMAGTFEIFSDRVITKNWNKLTPLSKSGVITIDELVNCTKNPIITKLFQKLGWVEELGSGIRNIKKYAPLYYSDSQISITNEEMFVFDITYRESVETEVATDLHKEVSVKTAGDSVKIPEVSVKTGEGSVKIPEASVKTVLPKLLMQTLKDKSGNMSEKKFNRICQTLMLIYVEEKITRPELLQKLNRSNSQIKNELIQLQQWEVVNINRKDNTYFIVDSYLHD